jgi:hypothetical protein
LELTDLLCIDALSDKFKTGHQQVSVNGGKWHVMPILTLLFFIVFWKLFQDEILEPSWSSLSDEHLKLLQVRGSQTF